MAGIIKNSLNTKRPLARQLAEEMTEAEISEVNGALRPLESGKFTKVHASIDVDYGDHTTTD